jgi:hypothetical protein
LRDQATLHQFKEGRSPPSKASGNIMDQQCRDDRKSSLTRDGTDDVKHFQFLIDIQSIPAFDFGCCRAVFDELLNRLTKPPSERRFSG